MISDYRYETKEVMASHYRKRTPVQFRDQRQRNFKCLRFVMLVLKIKEVKNYLHC